MHYVLSGSMIAAGAAGLLFGKSGFGDDRKKTKSRFFAALRMTNLWWSKKQIPFGNDGKKSKGKGKSGFFVAPLLRMTKSLGMAR
jgi:hypothetical protein